MPAIFDGTTLTITGFAPIAVASIARAWDATSHFPERHARMELEYLCERLNGFETFATEMAAKAEAPIILADELQRFTQNHLSLTRAFWASESRCMSWFIVGPARFPVERNQKRLRAADARREAVKHHYFKARRSLERRAFPHGLPGGPIRSDNPNAIDLVRQNIAEREAKQALMKAVNEAYRAAVKDPEGEKALRLFADLPPAGKLALRVFQPDGYYNMPYMSYSLSNNSAEIRRLKDRLTGLEREATKTTTETATNFGFTVRENVEACRLQLIFPGKPDSATRDVLKANGFRWAPSEGAWQRLLNNSARQSVEYIKHQLAKQVAA